MPKEEDVLTTIRWMEWYRQMSWPVPTWVYHLYLAYYHFESGSEGEEAQVSEQALSNTDSGDDDACDDVPMHEFHEEEEAERLQECDPEYGHASLDYEEEANIDYEDEADPNLECEAEADCEEEANIDHEEEAELSFEDESSDEQWAIICDRMMDVAEDSVEKEKKKPWTKNMPRPWSKKGVEYLKPTSKKMPRPGRLASNSDWGP